MEKKIMEYLGVDDFKNVKQLENYTVTFHNGNYFEVEDDKKKVEPNFEIEGGYEFKKDNNMIIALLEKQNQNNNKQKWLDNKHKNMKRKYFPFDTGHLLGVGLIKYLKICNKQKDNNRKKKDLVICEKNLIPQFQRANRNKKENIGQERFENWLTAYLKNNPKVEVYYETEKVYKNDADKSSLPIGTRILAYVAKNEPTQIKKNSRSKLELPFHVFIPNYQFPSDCKGQKNWPSFNLNGSEVDVHRLYKDGEYLKKYTSNYNLLSKL